MLTIGSIKGIRLRFKEREMSFGCGHFKLLLAVAIGSRPDKKQEWLGKGLYVKLESVDDRFRIEDRNIWLIVRAGPIRMKEYA